MHCAADDEKAQLQSEESASLSVSICHSITRV